MQTIQHAMKMYMIDYFVVEESLAGNLQSLPVQ